MKKMTWPELRAYIDAYNKKHNNHYGLVNKKLSAVIVFSNTTKTWWKHDWDLANRSYRIDNSDKLWYGECGGYSLYGMHMGDAGFGLTRLEDAVYEWDVEYCYIEKEEE